MRGTSLGEPLFFFVNEQFKNNSCLRFGETGFIGLRFRLFPDYLKKILIFFINIL